LDGSEDLPSDNAQFVNVTATEFTMPYNGYLYLVIETKSDNDCSLFVDGIEKWHFKLSNAYFHNGGSTTFIRKGQSIKLNGTYFYKRYEKAQGNGSLYYYVGETVQNANLINAGRIEEKVAEALAKPHIIETYVNGTSWYRVWSDGWIEQGGTTTRSATGEFTITFLKSFTNTNYTLMLSNSATSSGNAYAPQIRTKNKNNAVMYLATGTTATNIVNWLICGY
jgi:hypothetical protein